MATIDRWKRDPVTFIEEVCIDPETGKPFKLYREQKAFVREAFRLTEEGRMVYLELVFAAIKKSGKTGLAALFTIYIIVVWGGRYAEGYCCANDQEQSQGRVFQAIARIIQASPLLRAKVTASRIEFEDTGSTITALANDYAGAAGANPTITVFDELWAYTSERSHRMWDEMVPPPTRKVTCRLTVTYAGFEGESEPLESLYKQGLRGEQIAPFLYAQPGLLMFWSGEPHAPWQTPSWIEQMRKSLRANAFLRLIRNTWVTTESNFVEEEWWQRCIDATHRPQVSNPELPVYLGVDASVKRDSTAIVATTFDGQRVALVWHRIFQPSPDAPLDFEATIEQTLRELRNRFSVRKVLFDPYQMQASAQRLAKDGIPMEEFPQSVPNLTEASTNLYELIKGANLRVYPDEDITRAIRHAVAKETPRGWKIGKEKASHKIDVVVALAQAALATVRHGQSAIEIGPEDFYVVDREQARQNLLESDLVSGFLSDNDGPSFW